VNLDISVQLQMSLREVRGVSLCSNVQTRKCSF
jgi:hypothetical protein